MLKTLTLSLSLAVALMVGGVSKAGVFHNSNDNCSTCGLASPQGPVASAQGPIATSCEAPACGKKCNLFSGLGGRLDGLHCKLKGMLHPPVTYEWVLKKKRLWGHKNNCGSPACTTCETVYPTSQVAPSGQGYVTPAPQVYGAGQHTSFISARPAAAIASVPAEMTPAFPTGEEAPPAPEVSR
jgi:hypothetical protein